jgi:metal-responsive CopG/Arc/MetJ family transcriptional regulator
MAAELARVTQEEFRTRSELIREALRQYFAKKPSPERCAEGS